MQRGIIGLGMWCVDTTYKIDNLPERGKLEPISNTFQCVGGGPSNVLTDLNSLGFKHPMYAMGSIGLDTDASIIKKHCRENKIETKYLIVSKQISTSHTVCMFEKQKERTFLYYPGANSLLDKKHFKITNNKANFLEELNILDIGCGGGLLSEPMSKLGASVTGIDASKTNINIAKIHSKKNKLKINYICTSPENLKINKKFDIILNMEIVEHVEDVNYFINKSSQFLKKDGLMYVACLLYTSPSPRDVEESRMPSSA